MRKFYTKHDGVKYILRAKQKSPKCLSTPFAVKGVKWEIHNHDEDINNPSCPHMHAVGKPWKLDIYTGCFYNKITGKLLGIIKYKDLLEIWKAKGVLKIILEERAIYEELQKKNPVRFPKLPPLLTDENKKIQVNNINMHRKQYLYKIGTYLGVRSHLRKVYLESRFFRSYEHLQKPNKKNRN